jgi:hypothetical protein
MVKSHLRNKPLDLPRYEHPGKFEGEPRISEFIWDLSLSDGGGLGDVEGFGYYQQFDLGPSAVDEIAAQAKENDVELTVDEKYFIRSNAGAIISEDNNGFVSVEYFWDKDLYERRWRELEFQYERYLNAGYGQQQLGLEAGERTRFGEWGNPDG